MARNFLVDLLNVKEMCFCHNMKKLITFFVVSSINKCSQQFEFNTVKDDVYAKVTDND